MGCDLLFSGGLVCEVTWQEEETNDAINCGGDRLLVLLVCRATDLIDQGNDSFGATVIKLLYSCLLYTSRCV